VLLEQIFFDTEMIVSYNYRVLGKAES
jgi:hypothetical protein